MNKKRVTHTFDPIFNIHSQILIVGTMPSVASRKNNFYYGHPRNRFYPVLAALLQTQLPQTNEQKLQMLLKEQIAVYDVLHACDIKDSEDSSIKNEEVNDFSQIFDTAKIKQVFANGRTAQTLYEKHVGSAVYLPSTSPANAAFALHDLIDAWSLILEYLHN